MSLVIRFSKIGRKGEAKFRIVVKEKRSKRDGAAIDTLGFYNKSLKDSTLNLDQNRFSYWKGQGAMVSPALEKALLGSKARLIKARGTDAAQLK